MIKPVQIRMARAALSWGVRDLADKAGITANTVTRIENGSEAKQSTIKVIRAALESGGVEFIAENGGGVGVRLRQKSPRGDPSASIKVEDLTAENDE